MSPESAENIFTWNGISILQQDDVFKIGTDALVLGAWVPKVIHGTLQILDVGTGTGILALMMAYAFPNASIKAIDLDFSAVALADTNFRKSLWADRISVYHGDILTVPKHASFDLIICNPPFFFKQLEAKKEVNAKAKHAADSCKVWMKGMTEKLKADGHLCIVVPADLAFNWIQAANETGFYCVDRLDIYSFDNDNAPTRSLLHCHSKLSTPVISRLTVHKSIKEYSQEYLKLSRIHAAGL